MGVGMEAHAPQIGAGAGVAVKRVDCNERARACNWLAADKSRQTPLKRGGKVVLRIAVRKGKQPQYKKG